MRPRPQNKRLPSNLRPQHTTQHSKPSPQPVFAIKVRQHFAHAIELGRRILRLLEWNFADQNAGSGLGNPVVCNNVVHLPQARGYPLARDDQQHRNASIWDRQLIGEPLPYIDAGLAHQSDLFVRRQKANARFTPRSCAMRSSVPSPHPISSSSSSGPSSATSTMRSCVTRVTLFLSLPRSARSCSSRACFAVSRQYST